MWVIIAYFCRIALNLCRSVMWIDSLLMVPGESDLSFMVPEPGPSLAAPSHAVLFILSRLKILILVVFVVSGSRLKYWVSENIGWIKIHPLFHPLRVLQRLVLQKLLPL